MKDLSKYSQQIFTPITVAVSAGILLLTVVMLKLEGRVWWCQAGDLVPWSWDIWSRHSSQHFIDPYSFTHMLHGVLWFWLISLVFRKMPTSWMYVLAVTIECCWEMIENSPYIIERYRTVTISLDYFGDSVINSISDVLFCSLGFYLAYKLRFWRALIWFVATELLLLFFVHDNLTINIIMLIYPVEWIKHWQMGH